MAKQFTEEDCGVLALQFRTGVPVKDRKLRFKTYKDCFVGSEAVDFIMKTSNVVHRPVALSLGQKLMDTGLFSHVLNDEQCEDGNNIFYRFNSLEVIEELKKQRSVFSKEGYLDKKTITGWTRFWIEIKGTILKLFPFPGGKPKAKCNVSQCTIQDSSPVAFEIKLINGSSLTLRADSEKEKLLWVGVIYKAKESITESQKLLEIWKKDPDECVVCMAALAAEAVEKEEKSEMQQLDEKSSSPLTIVKDAVSSKPVDLPLSKSEENTDVMNELLSIQVTDILENKVSFKDVFKQDVIVLALLRHFG